MTGTYAATTEVSSSKSRDEIERTLTRYGADQFMYGWKDTDAMIAFRKDGRQIRFVLPLPCKDEKRFTEYTSRAKLYARTPEASAKLFEQAIRQKWRALALVIKAKLEAIEAGISLFEDEFMANIVLPDGRSVGDWMRPQIAQAYQIGAMPELLPLLPAPTAKG